MSTGFNVETYQLNKQENDGSGSTYDILNRIEQLESNQMNVFNQLIVDFSKEEYVDKYLTTVVFTADGIIARQYQSRWYDGLTYDDCIDWDKSKYIAFTNQSIKLDTPSTAYGEFYSLPLNLASNFIGFKFNADVDVPIIETLLGRKELAGGHLWMAQGVDNYDRIWVFRSDTYKFEAATVYVKIFNPDLSVYKEFTIPGANFFGPVQMSGAYGYSPIHGSAKVIFSEENLCIIGFMMINATKDGMIYEAAAQDSNHHSAMKNIVTFVDENGNSKVKYNYIQSMEVYNNYRWYYGYYYRHAYNVPFEPVRMIIQKNKIIMFSGSTARIFGDVGYDTARYGKAVIAPSTGLLNDVNVTVISSQSWGSYYEYSAANIRDWATRFNTDLFQIGGVNYMFITSYNVVTSEVPVGDICLAEFAVTDLINMTTVVQDKSYLCTGTLTNGPWAFGGANGLYYDKVHNYLYVFSNSTSSPVLNITRFEVDWTSKNSTANTIALINPKTKSYNLQNTTYNSSHTTFFTQKLRVYDDGKLLNLVYGTNNAVTTKREIDYMSMDYNMNIVQPPSQIHVSDGSAVDAITSFDMAISAGEKLILYARGDRDDFNDVTATVNSAIYTDQVTQVASKIDFYYSTDTDRTWKPMNTGDTKTLLTPANELNIRAVLQSSGIYDSSPVINSMSVESWDNNNAVSRQSEYISPQLDVLQSEGKAVLTADQDVGDGQIDWYVSFNGGLSWTLTQLNTEFVYNYASTPDFRVQAVLSVKDNALNPPIVHSYTIKTSHMVLHSDLEEIQINLMKTNFKIDTYTKASKNGLLKMTIDTFSNDSAIDVANSDYYYYVTTGTVGGNYITTKPEVINDTVLTFLLTTDEVTDSSQPNSHIEYEVSIDGGITFKQVNPNIKTQLNNTNSPTSTLILKAVFYDNAQLSAWGWAWD